MNKVIVQVTYELITNESAEMGCTEDQGFEHEDLEFESREAALLWFNNQYGCNEELNDGEIYRTIDPELDLYDGSEMYYTLHF